MGLSDALWQEEGILPWGGYRVTCVSNGVCSGSVDSVCFPSEGNKTAGKRWVFRTQSLPIYAFVSLVIQFSLNGMIPCLLPAHFYQVQNLCWFLMLVPCRKLKSHTGCSAIFELSCPVLSGHHLLLCSALGCICCRPPLCLQL